MIFVAIIHSVHRFHAFMVMLLPWYNYQKISKAYPITLWTVYLTGTSINTFTKRIHWNPTQAWKYDWWCSCRSDKTNQQKVNDKCVPWSQEELKTPTIVTWCLQDSKYHLPVEEISSYSTIAIFWRPGKHSCDYMKKSVCINSREQRIAVHLSHYTTY